MTPGTGKILTIHNILNYSYKEMSFSLIGMTIAMLMIAILAALGINLFIINYPNTYLFIQIIGVFYIFYLSYLQFNSSTLEIEGHENHTHDNLFYFVKKGFLITIMNPKQLIFFGSIFPQFIITGGNYWEQISILIFIFTFFFVFTHYIYAYFSNIIKNKFKENVHFNKIVSLTISAIYFLFACVMGIKIILG